MSSSTEPSIKKGEEVKTLLEKLGVTITKSTSTYDTSFYGKLQMIFDEGNSTSSSVTSMDVVNERDDNGTYYVDTNFLVKSLGDSFHDMFDPGRSTIERSLTSFQEFLLARFASSFQKNNDNYNKDLCYKILQIYIKCHSDPEIGFFDKNGVMRKNLDGNLIARTIFNTELLNFNNTPNNDQFNVFGNIIEYQPKTQYRDTVVANLLLDSRYNPQSNEVIMDDLPEGSLNGVTDDKATKLIYDRYRGTYLESVFDNLFALYSGDGLLELIKDMREYMNDSIGKLKEKAQISREGGRHQYVPSVNSCFPYIHCKPLEINKIKYFDRFDIRTVVTTERESDFKFINEENTRLLVGDGDVVVVADFDKRTEFIRKLAGKHLNKVFLSRVLATSLDEAPDSFSKTITELSTTANMNTFHSECFKGNNENSENSEGSENTITFKIGDQKLYSYTVKKEPNEINTQFLDNIIRKIDEGNVEEVIHSLDVLNNNNTGIYEKIVKRMELKNFPVVDSNLEVVELPNINKNIVKRVLESNFRNTSMFIKKIVSDELNRCYLEIKLYNNPFKQGSTIIEKISVGNMSSQIKHLMGNNSELSKNIGKKKSQDQNTYITNLIQIDMFLQGKESGDILPALSTLKIVNDIKSKVDYVNLPSSFKITSTVITSADKNAILNLLSLARINHEKFDKSIIIFNHSIASDENSTAVRIGDNRDIFNDYYHGKLDSIPKYFKLEEILTNNRVRIRDNIDPTNIGSRQKEVTNNSYISRVVDFFSSLTNRFRSQPSSQSCPIYSSPTGKKTKTDSSVDPYQSQYSQYTPNDSDKQSQTGLRGVSVDVSPVRTGVNNELEQEKNSPEKSPDKRRKTSNTEIGGRDKGGSRKHHIQTHKSVTRRKTTTKSSKRKTIKKRKMQKRNSKTRRHRK